jgi:hypothetical protein
MFTEFYNSRICAAAVIIAVLNGYTVHVPGVR